MNFNDSHANFNVIFSENHLRLKIVGNVKNVGMYKKVVVMAPNPIDRMSNYTGSGLPFPNNEIAFENTPNIVDVSNTGVINTVFSYPNSFYMPDGMNKIISSIFIVFTENNGNVFHKYYKLHDMNVLRTLVNRSVRNGPEFYAAKDYLLPIATAENVMYAYAKAKIENDIG